MSKQRQNNEAKRKAGKRGGDRDEEEEEKEETDMELGCSRYQASGFLRTGLQHHNERVADLPPHPMLSADISAT